MFDSSRNVDLENLCAFDFETTGLSAGFNRVVEIGACRYVNGKYEIFQKLVNPGRPIPLEAKKIHGIGDKDVESAPSFKEVAQEFIDFIGDRALIAHNSNFDLGYLVIEMQRAGIPVPTNPIFDTLRMSKVIRKGASSHRLDICHRLLCNVSESVERHRAGEDSKSCLEIADVMFKMKKEVASQQIRHHFEWAGGTIQFKDHNFSQKSVGFDKLWYFDIMKVDGPLSVLYTKGVNEDIVFG
jgi:DNA polymerase III epsilon subunit family exonuclease